MDFSLMIFLNLKLYLLYPCIFNPLLFLNKFLRARWLNKFIMILFSSLPNTGNCPYWCFLQWNQWIKVNTDFKMCCSIFLKQKVNFKCLIGKWLYQIICYKSSEVILRGFSFQKRSKQKPLSNIIFNCWVLLKKYTECLLNRKHTFVYSNNNMRPNFHLEEMWRNKTGK